MAVKRRKSNWYIYMLTFIITFALLALVIWQLRGYLFPNHDSISASNNRVGADTVPDSSHNMTVLFMLSEKKGGTPDYYMIINYRPADETAVIIPLKSALGKGSENLGSYYAAGGVSRVESEIENIFGVKCNKYVKLDKSAFIELTEAIGEITVNIPTALTSGGLSFEAGPNVLVGDSLYEYITFPEYSEGEDYRMVVHGSAIANLINSHSKNLSTIDMQSYFNLMLTNADTDLSFEFYTEHQSAFVYTSNNSSNIAEYYVPYGEYNENGIFIPAENSINTIKDRVGLIS